VGTGAGDEHGPEDGGADRAAQSAEEARCRPSSAASAARRAWGSPSEPIGLQLARVAKGASRAFDAALAAEGGSVPTWLILLSLKTGKPETQRELARAVGIEGPTLTHHLAKLEAGGLVTRTREAENRRVHRVELTAAAEAAFDRLRRAAVRFDAKLRGDLGEDELTRLRGLLDALDANLGG
jgi:MarR family transcriptional regulator for hemolysin